MAIAAFCWMERDSAYIGGVVATVSSRTGASVDLRFYRGDKRYEISNHLGNVLVVVSDRNLWVSSTTVNFDHYLADLYSVQDYDPFGMGIPERSWSAPEEHRYRFNGKETCAENLT